MIDVNKVYDLLAKKDFQDARSNALFFPAYIYTYDATKEYEVRNEILLLHENLSRPDNNLDSLLINIYNEMIEYLKAEEFIGLSLFDNVIEDESKEPNKAQKWISNIVSSKEFYNKLENKVCSYFEKQHDRKRVYVLVYGFGSSFPYIRTSTFLKRTEKIVKNFKMIIFYPGQYKNSNYHLFGLLNDHVDNIYRANLLNNLIK